MNSKCTKCSECHDIKRDYDNIIIDHNQLINLVVSLTDECNLRCRYCFVRQAPKTMEYSTLKRACEYVLETAAESGAIPTISLFGGEPMLCYESLIKPIILEYGSRINFEITTNGTLLTEESIIFFRQHNVHPLLSIDGAETSQNKNRPGKGFNSFEQLKTILPFFILNFPNTVFRSTVMPDDIPLMYENYLFAKSYGFLNVVMIPAHGYEFTKDDFVKATEQSRKIALDICKNLDNGILPPRMGRIISAYNAIKRKEKTYNNGIYHCGTGLTSAGVDTEGNIYPCQEENSVHSLSIGNLDDGIDYEKLDTFVINQFEGTNRIKCCQEDNYCPTMCKAYCYNNQCPNSLLRDNYVISSAQCVFNKMQFIIGNMLYQRYPIITNQLLQAYFNYEQHN